jgi:hypothetical protein
MAPFTRVVVVFCGMMPFLSVALAANPPAFGWDTQTHRAITAEALT